jgi:hypothetical protein
VFIYASLQHSIFFFFEQGTGAKHPKRLLHYIAESYKEDQQVERITTRPRKLHRGPYRKLGKAIGSLVFNFQIEDKLRRRPANAPPGTHHLGRVAVEI